MKTFYSFLFTLFLVSMQAIIAQSPQKLNYQAVIRDASGNPLLNTTVGIKLSILQGSSTGTAVCIEEFSPSTNEYGLVTLEIGSINTVDFEAIDWSDGPYFLKIELDTSGGSNYIEMGSTQLLSVPYALHAHTVDDFEGEIVIDNNGPAPNTEQIRFLSNGAEMSRIESYTSDELNAKMVFSNASSGTLTEHMRINSSGNVGIGTKYPQELLHVFKENAVAILEVETNSSTEEPLLKLTNKAGSYGLFTDNGKFGVHDYGTELNRLIIDGDGRLGIGTNSPSATLDVNGSFSLGSTYPADAWSQGLIAIGPIGGYFGSQGNYRSYWTWNGYRQTGTNDWVVGGASTFTSSGFISLGENGIDFRTREYGSSGVFTWPYSRMLINNQGNIGVNSLNPTSKFEIQGESTWSDETPLFEVKNNDGITVFAVYNNGVRITIEDDPLKKRPKGGFAIGGFDPTKAGATVDFMRITPDSIRFNIDNSNTKGPKGGFAIGGFDRTKGAYNEDFMYITPTSSSSGSYNTKLGYQSGYSLSGGLNNVMIGYKSGYNTEGMFFQSQGSRNVFIGNYSGFDNITGKDNIAIGHEAGKAILGDENIFIGTGAGKLLDGSGNIIIGKWPDGYFGTSESNNFIISNGSSTLPMLAGNFQTRELMIDADLYLYHVWNKPFTSGYRDVAMISPGILGYISSSKRYKENIEDISNIDWFYDVRPVEFNYKSDKTKKLTYGLIAEELEKVIPEFVSYNKEGQVETVTYSMFITPLIKVVQDQNKRIEALENELAEIKELLLNQ